MSFFTVQMAMACEEGFRGLLSEKFWFTLSN